MPLNCVSFDLINLGLFIATSLAAGGTWFTYCIIKETLKSTKQLFDETKEKNRLEIMPLFTLILKESVDQNKYDISYQSTLNVNEDYLYFMNINQVAIIQKIQNSYTYHNKSTGHIEVVSKNIELNRLGYPKKSGFTLKSINKIEESMLDEIQENDRYNNGIFYYFKTYDYEVYYKDISGNKYFQKFTGGEKGITESTPQLIN